MKVTVSDAVLASIHSLSIGAGKDDVTPLLTQIALSREGDDLRAAVTDRFIVLTGLYKNADWEDWEEGGEILIDPRSLKTVVDMNKKDKFVTSTQIVQGEDSQVFASMVNGTSVNLSPLSGRVSGKFPPLMKLFPTGEPNGSASLNIRPDFIAKLAKVLPPENRPERDRIWSFEFRSMEDNLNKPEPVYAHYSGGELYKMEALIQPARMAGKQL